MSPSRSRNVILILSVLLVAAGLFLVFRPSGSEGAAIEILLNGDVYGRYSLNEDRTIDVGGCLTVSVKDGEVEVVKSDCPGQTCVRQRPIRNEGEMIVCLPNQVVIRILGAREDGLDYVI